MEDIIKWANKNMYISIFTVIHNNRIEWSAGVRIGLEARNTWLPSKDDTCQFSSFLTPEKALDEAIKFCEEYKPKAIRPIIKSGNGKKK